MKQAIDFSHYEQEFLNVGSRRKSINTFMLLVSKGCILVRLGKHEYTVKSGHGFVIPFDCLHAITVLPGTIYSKVDFSARITSPVCKEAGFFRKNPLINAVIDELIKCQARDNETPLSGASGNLLRVLADQIGSLKVNTKSTSPELAAKYQPVLACMLKGDSVTDKTACSTIEQYLGYSIKELKTCVVMREALRLARSGRKPHQIAETLKTDESLLVAMAQPILGHAL